MPKSIQVAIKNPCHEDWNKMNPVEKGMFCNSCRKQVIDFTAMSDREIAEFFKKPSTGSVCGRFTHQQLEQEFELPRKRIPWLRYFFQFTIPAFLFSLKTNSAKAQAGKSPVADTTVNPVKEQIPESFPFGKIAVSYPRRKYAEGYVRDSSGVALQSVGILQKNTNNATVTDAKGYFRLYLNQAPENDILVTSYAGYKPSTIYMRYHRDSLMNFTLTYITPVMEATFDDPIPQRREPREIKIIKPSAIKASKTVLLEGIITDDYGKRVPFATIAVKGTDCKVESDSTGYYRAKITADEDHSTLIADGPRYFMSSEVSIPEEENRYFDIMIQHVYLGEVSIDTTLKNRKLVSIAHKTDIDIDMLTPSPGSSITIDLKKLAPANYSVQLVGDKRRILLEKHFRVEGPRILILTMPNEIEPGKYFLRFTNKDAGRSFKQKIIVQ